MTPQGVAASSELALELQRQARLFLAAKAVLGSGGTLPLRRLRTMQDKGGGVLRAAAVRAAWSTALAGGEGAASGPPG